MSSRSRILRLLEKWCPWWSSDKWYLEDDLLISFRRSVLRKLPRLYYHIRKNIVKKGKYGIVTIRGPRRTGKTTMIKYLIKNLIEECGIEPRRIFYFPLDSKELRSIGLERIIEVIASTGEGEKYVFIDEVTAYKDWALELKVIYDRGLVTKGRLKIIVLGSHSLDLKENLAYLRDRRGDLAYEFNLGGNLIHLPFRFSEIVEALRESYREIGNLLHNHGLVLPKKRFEILYRLYRGEIPKILEEIYDEYFSLLDTLFQDYLLHGGFPKAVNEYKSSGSISSTTYYEYASLIIEDARLIGLDSESLKNVITYLTEPKRLSGTIDLDRWDNVPILDQQKGKYVTNPNYRQIKPYLEYLRTSWTYIFTYREQEHDYCTPNKADTHVKLYIVDPFIYFALYCYMRNIVDPFTTARQMINDEGFKGQLVESIVASHLILAQQLFEHVTHIDYDRVLMYRKTRNNEKEYDIILCISKKNMRHRFQIEVKYRREPIITIETTENMIILTRDYLYTTEIETRDKTGKRKVKVTYIPVPIFLLLF